MILKYEKPIRIDSLADLEHFHSKHSNMLKMVPCTQTEYPLVLLGELKDYARETVEYVTLTRDDVLYSLIALGDKDDE